MSANSDNANLGRTIKTLNKDVIKLHYKKEKKTLGRVSKRHGRGRWKKASKNRKIRFSKWNLHRDKVIRT